MNAKEFAFGVEVGGITYDVYHTVAPKNGEPVTVALRIRPEGVAELTAFVAGHCGEREISAKIAGAQREPGYFAQ